MLLIEHLEAVTTALDPYLGTLTDDDLDDVLDEQWDPPVTRGVRLVSLLDDAAQHIGQAAYVVGMPRRDRRARSASIPRRTSSTATTTSSSQYSVTTAITPVSTSATR